MIDLLKETKSKSSVLFIGFIVALSQTAHAEVILGKNFTSTEITTFSTVLKEVEQVLPEEIRNKLPLIQIDKDVTRTGLSLMPLPICRGEKAQGDDQSDFTYAAYNHITKKISVHPSVINEILKGPDVARSYNCGHRNSYLLARASLLHEIIHAYDYALPKKDSSAPEYLYLARWKRTLIGIKNLNQKPDRSPDYYEFENIREHFAVNMEFFLLDPEYKCRRPGLYDYFSKKYKTVPFPEYACEGLTGIHRISDGLINYFDLAPERVYRIDLVIASKGEQTGSGFGHSLFRVVICAPERVDVLSGKTLLATPIGPKCLEDTDNHLYLSFAAELTDSEINIWKGLFGGYRSNISIMTTKEVKDTYTIGQLRDLSIYAFNFDEEEKVAFLNNLREAFWQYNGKYKFLTNNCATESHEFLKYLLARRGLKFNKQVFKTPYGLLKTLEKANMVTKAGEIKGQRENYLKAVASLTGISTPKMEDIQSYVASGSDDNKMSFQKKFDSSSLSEQVELVTSYLFIQKYAYSQRAQKLQQDIIGRLKKEDPEYQAVSKALLSKLSSRNLAPRSTYGVPLQSEVQIDVEGLNQSHYQFTMKLRKELEVETDLSREVKKTLENIKEARNLNIKLRRQTGA